MIQSYFHLFSDEDKSKSQDKGLKPIRFLKNKEKVSRRMASRNIAKSERQQKQLSERTQRKEGTVILTRKYRKGDLPDIEIPYSGFINSLRALAKVKYTVVVIDEPGFQKDFFWIFITEKNY